MSLIEDVLRFGVAVGHVQSSAKGNPLVVPDYAYLSIALKAAGSTTAMTASDLLKFAAAHMNRGVGLNGVKILNKRSADEMTKVQIKSRTNTDFGLPWKIGKWNGVKILQHGGATIGQQSLLILCPEKKLAITAMTNGGSCGALIDEIVGGLLKTLVKIDMPGRPDINAQLKYNPDHFTGSYANMNHTLIIGIKEGQLLLSIETCRKERLQDDITINFAKNRLGITDYGGLEFGGSNDQVAEWVRFQSRLFVKQ
ncbi:MAG: serine hydrolase [Planctomycetes bacterium]|nr:serine hydrolase [Planctomycetota bacterium]